MSYKLRGVVAVLCITFACVSSSRVQHFVAGPDSLHPRLKFADSLVSVNHRCVVSGSKLNPKVRPVYVNGVPIGFC